MLSIVLIITLGFAVYSNSINGQFIWDDDILVKNNIFIKNWHHLPKIFSEHITAGAGRNYSFYRPIQIFTYLIDYSIWKLDVRGYHLTNILLHILVVLCIYWLTSIIFGDWLLSLLTSLLFIAHPIHTEAIVYISGRCDSLALLFMLCCFTLYIKNLTKSNTGIFVFMILSYIFSMLSKESSLILPLLLLVYHFSLKNKLQLKPFLWIISISLFYILLRSTVIKFLLPHTSCPTTILQRFPGFFIAITNYLRLLLVPLNLHMEYGKELFNIADPKAILGIVITLSLLIYAYKIRNNNRLVFFSIFWFFITLLPVSNLYPINAYMAEHWLYVPSIGYFLILAKGLSYIYKTSKFRVLSVVLILTILTFYSYLTIKQNNYWQGPLVFSERTLKYAPYSARANNNLGFEYTIINKENEAIALFKNAIEIDPDYAHAYYNLGYLYDTINHKKEAMTLYKKAIEIDPNFAEPYNNLGNLYKALNNQKQAIELYKKAIGINPYYVEAYNNLGVAYRNIHMNELAVASYKKAIEINPNIAILYINLGNVYNDLDKNEKAIEAYKKAIEINPDFKEILNLPR